METLRLHMRYKKPFLLQEVYIRCVHFTASDIHFPKCHGNRDTETHGHQGMPLAVDELSILKGDLWGTAVAEERHCSKTTEAMVKELLAERDGTSNGVLTQSFMILKLAEDVYKSSVYLIIHANAHMQCCQSEPASLPLRFSCMPYSFHCSVHPALTGLS